MLDYDMVVRQLPYTVETIELLFSTVRIPIKKSLELQEGVISPITDLLPKFYVDRYQLDVRRVFVGSCHSQDAASEMIDHDSRKNDPYDLYTYVTWQV